MRNLICVGEHTVDANLLTSGGYVLDAGCRDFTFARGLAERGCRVVAVDADPTVEDPSVAGIAFANVAIAAQAGSVSFRMAHNPEARGFAHLVGGDGPVTTVRAVTIEDLMARYDVKLWDAVKLDVEGAEYDLLRAWPGPVAKQISIEFHEHCGARPQAVYDQIFKHLGQWYDLVQHEKTARHCTHPNFWDTVLVLK